jgi:hypothetical protein
MLIHPRSFARGRLVGILALAACSNDVVATRAPSSAAVKDMAERDPELTPPATTTTSNHIAYWLLGQPYVSLSVPGIYDWVIPSSGSRITAQRLAAGYYIATVPGMSDVFHPGNKEIVMTTASRDTTPQCTVPAWVSSATSDVLQVTTFCNDMHTGQRADGEFETLIVGNNTMSGVSAFAVANLPSALSYTPDTARSFTTGAGAIHIDRNAIGDWNVSLGTGSAQGSIFLVSSAYELAVCTVGEWKNFGIRVRCFDQIGAPVDAQFNVLQVAGGRFSNQFGSMYPFAFAWADQRQATAPYTPNPSFSRSSGGAITATRLGVGNYQVEFQGLQNPLNDPEQVQVTPFGVFYAVCTAVRRSDSATGRIVSVLCRDAQGTPMDTRFNILLMR